MTPIQPVKKNIWVKSNRGLNSRLNCVEIFCKIKFAHINQDVNSLMDSNSCCKTVSQGKIFEQRNAKYFTIKNTADLGRDAILNIVKDKKNFEC